MPLRAIALNGLGEVRLARRANARFWRKVMIWRKYGLYQIDMILTGSVAKFSLLLHYCPFGAHN